MNVLREAVRIHKEELSRGTLGKTPKWALRLWYYYRLYVAQDCELLTDTLKVPSVLRGFLLWNPSKKEIVVLCVAREHQRSGVGTLLVNRLPYDDVTVCYDRKHEQSREFYKRNGFKDHYFIGHEGDVERWKAVRRGGGA